MSMTPTSNKKLSASILMVGVMLLGQGKGFTFGVDIFFGCEPKPHENIVLARGKMDFLFSVKGDLHDSSGGTHDFD